MRIGGLASGMDIDSIVKDMMKVKRMPLDKMKQQKQILEWKRDDYRSINTMLLGFRDRLAQLKLTSNYRARMVSSTDEAKVSATVTSGAAQASYSISKVERLATAATRVGGEITTLDPGNSLKDEANTGIDWKQGVIETKTFPAEGKTATFNVGGNYIENTLSVKVNGKTLKVGEDVTFTSNGTLSFKEDLPKGASVKVDYAIDKKITTYDIAEKQTMISLGKGSITDSTLIVNFDGKTFEVKPSDDDGYPMLKAVDENGEIIKDENGKEIVFGRVDLANGTIMMELPEMEGKKVEVSFTQDFTTFDIGSHTSKGEVNEKIFVTGNDSLNTVIRKVNESSAGITMFYDDFKKQITATRKETGKYGGSDESDFIFSDNENDFLNKIMNMNGNLDEAGKPIGTDGKNAIFTINGLETQRQSNTFSMNGVTFTLKQVFTEGPPTTLNVSNDSEGVLKTVKDFVDQYNTLIDDINKKLNEERNRKYLPLTDDDREELSDKQQEKWEELAKSGLLKGDPMLSSVLSQMRMDMSSSVETNGLFKQLAAIGITTTANYLDGGKLEINETKLKEAIEQDPDSVENLFRGTGTNDSDRGVIHKLYDSVNQSITKIQDRAGRATSTNQQFTLGRELISVDKNIDSFETRLKMQEDRLWRQFTAMEKAIQRANNQAVYLMQQFGGGMY